MAKKKEAAKKKADAAPKKKATVVSYVRELLEDDGRMSTQDMIKVVKRKFPKSKFNKSHVAYYRNKLRAEGMDIPKLRDMEGGKKKKSSAKKKSVSKKKAGVPKKKVARRKKSA